MKIMDFWLVFGDKRLSSIKEEFAMYLAVLNGREFNSVQPRAARVYIFFVCNTHKHMICRRAEYMRLSELSTRKQMVCNIWLFLRGCAFPLSFDLN